MLRTLKLVVLPLASLEGLPAPHPLAELPSAIVTADAGQLVIELPPVDLMPSGLKGSMGFTPVCRVDVPITASLYAFRVEVVDADGQSLPLAFLHHVNLTDPSRRELFLPTSLHLIAASKETPALSMPRLLFGMPIRAGDRYVVSGMLTNPTPKHQHDVRIRLVYSFIEPSPLWPLWEAYPWVMDVMFPLGKLNGGSKAFNLTPGRSQRSWEASPAVPGRLLGLGGHVHDYGTSLELKDVTTGEVLWREEPIRDSTGRVITMPVARFYRWYRLGPRIEPTHRYRVTVTYDNPTGKTIVDGGMGAVAGAFVPDRAATWPAVDPTDPVYLQDLANTLLNRPEPTMRSRLHH